MKLKLLAILLSTFVMGGIQARAVAQSPDKAATTPITVGQTAPDFALADEKGTSVRLANELKKNAVVLVFYRGYW